MIAQSFVVVFVLYFGTSLEGVKAQLNICPVQGDGRELQPGYPLIQCYQFYSTGGCCKRHEEQAVFNRFSELRFTSNSDICIALMSNLLCYICSPDQVNWYSNNTVTICGEFCDYLWSRCFSDAKFGNDRIQSLYSGGRDFCRREGFVVQENTDQLDCYNFHSSLSTNGAATLKISGMFVILFASFVTFISIFV